MSSGALRQAAVRPKSPDLALSLGGRWGLVEALAHLLAGLEERHGLSGYRNLRSGARVPADPCLPVFDRKRPEAAELDAVAARQRRGDLIEDGIDDLLDVPEIKMRVAIGNPLYKLGFDHQPPANRFCGRAGSRKPLFQRDFKNKY